MYFVQRMEKETETPFFVAKLEDVTRDINPLFQFLFGVNHPEPDMLVGKEVNRHIVPESWTDKKAADFEEICGEAMNFFGYELT